MAATRWVVASLAATKWASGILGDGQGEESGDFGVVQAAAKQAALGWPGGLGNSSASQATTRRAASSSGDG